VTIHESGKPSVVVFGQPTGLAEAIVAALRRNGFLLAHRRPLCEQPPRRSRWLTDSADPEWSGDSPYRSIDSAIILGAASTESLFKERISCASRRRLKACENDICRSAVSTVLAHGATRVLLVGDTRRLSFGQRTRALRWLRDLAARIDYESAINGVDEVVTSCALVDTDDDVDRIAADVVTWHSGKDGSEPKTTTSPVVLGSAEVEHRRRTKAQPGSTERRPNSDRLRAA
jgi:hypothetical protein